ncbi:MAG: fibronectin type III domain-containing protein [Lachnospiraceae bacterium]|nr:fibronectin type III domain-containing protein [Lachnospiraceae bacterium]
MKKNKVLALLLSVSVAAATGLPAVTVSAEPSIASSAPSITSAVSTEQGDGFSGLAEAASNAEVQGIELSAEDEGIEAIILEGMLNGETEITVPASEAEAEAAVGAALEDTKSANAVDAEVVTESGETTVVLDVDPRTQGIIEFMNQGNIMSGGSEDTISSLSAMAVSGAEDSEASTGHDEETAAISGAEVTASADEEESDAENEEESAEEGEDPASENDEEDPETSVDPVTNQDPSGFTGITVEEKAGILAAYQEMASFKEQYADLFGVDVPYNTYKDNEQNPLTSTLSLTYIYYDPEVYDVEVDGQPAKVGGFYRLNMLGGGGGSGYVTVSLADGTTQERSYMDGQSIIFMLKTFNASNQIGAQLFGEGILEDRQGVLTEIATAEQAAAAQGAVLSDAEKYLIINDYISTHARLDMEYMLGSQGLSSRDTAVDPYYDTIHGALSQNQDYISLPDDQKAYMIEGVENMWKTNQIGSLGMGTGLCISYVNAFSYLVQCMHSDIYQNEDGSWKNYREVNYIQNEDGTYEQSAEAGYVVDVVDSVLNAFSQTYGEGQYATSDHYWNTVLSDGTWYNVDTNYSDAYISSMLMQRGEVDGSLNHLPFMFCEEDWINLFGEEHFVSIDSMYSDLTTDDSLEHTWFSFANGPVSIGSDGFYYAYDSTDTFELLNSASSFNIDQEAMTPVYKICRRDYGLADTSDAMTELIAFAVSDSSDAAAGTTVYNPSTDSMEKNEVLTALYEKMVQEMEIYPAIAITGSLYEGKFYFNLSNCIVSYDISTGAVEKVKEYNTVSAARDWTKKLGCDAFTITNDAASADITVENHPLTSLAVIDGQMHTAVATNYALISTPGWRYFPDVMGYTGIAGYGYEFEETNYNADYIDYDEYLDGEYGDILKNFLTQEENDNGEFFYTASIHDHTISMDQLTGSHNYETVSVSAACGQNAYTEERCTDCGAIKEGSRIEEEGTAHEHHYVKFDETYYRTDDNSSVKYPTIGQSLQDPTITYETGTSYVCIHCLTATEEEPDVYDTHTYFAEGAEWTETSGPDGKKSYSDYSVSVSRLVCDEGCTDRVGKLDAYLSDDALEISFDEPVTAEAELTYKGTCEEGAIAVYTALIETENNGSYTVTKEEQLEAGSHQCDAEFTWETTKNASGEVTGVKSVSAVMTCKACGTVSEPQECEVTFESISEGEAEGENVRYTAAVTYGGYTYEDVFETALAEQEIAVPEIVSVYANPDGSEASQRRVKITWNAAEGVDGYEIHRSTSQDGEFTRVKTIWADEEKTGYTNTGLEIGQTYYYKVCAFMEKDAARTYSDFSEIMYVPGAVAMDKGYSNAPNRIRLLWNEVAGADGYQIWRAEEENGTYRIVKTIQSGDITAYSNVLEDGQSGVFYYKLRAFRSEGDRKIFGAYSSVEAAATMPEQVQASAASYTRRIVTVQWEETAGADGYQVWRYDEEQDKFIIVKSITDSETVSYKVRGLESGKEYTFKVRAYSEINGKKTFGAYSDDVVIKAK